jgi:hypothetical protein
LRLHADQMLDGLVNRDLPTLEQELPLEQRPVERSAVEDFVPTAPSPALFRA